MSERWKRDALFFGEYLALLLIALLWVQLAHVRVRVGPHLGLLYAVDAGTIAYVLVRAWLVMVRRAGRAWEPLFLVVDLAVISTFVRLTGGIASEAGLVYLWPLAISTVGRAPGRVIAVGGLIGACYLASTWDVAPVPDYAERLLVRLLVLGLVVALAYSQARAEAARTEEVARLREQVAVADFRTRVLHETRERVEQYLGQVETQLDAAARTAQESPERAVAAVAELRETLGRAAEDLQQVVRRVRAPEPDE
jgi:hypothetical protein